MAREIIGIAGSVILVAVSWKSLFHPRSHGFSRFFSWECILVLFLLNVPYWFREPLAPNQIVSWIFLVASIVLVIAGVRLLKAVGRPSRDRSDETLIAFEKTSALVTVGAYKYIRHPMYSSLLFLAWGVFLKRFSWVGLGLAGLATLFLFLTAKRDEAECLKQFGDAYRSYMQGTKRFVPFLF